MTPAEEDIATQIVDALNAVFGVHSGYRAVHAKGIVCQGTFYPAATAASISRAPHLQNNPVPITVRFSDFPGIPNVPDGDPNANPRGLAIKFHLPGDLTTDIVAHSYNGFPVSTGEEFLGFIRALAASGPGVPKPTPIEVFASSRPQTLQFLTASQPIPASFATEPYYGVNAFKFTNRDAVTRHGRYWILPVAGTMHLAAADAQARPNRFLFDELTDRLSRGPVEFRLMVQLADDDDPVHDGSLTWPEDRPQVELGRLSVTSVVPDSALAELQLIFDPIRLVDGIELSDDPLPTIRSRVYSVSYGRRHQ
jgi:catalase